MKVCVCVVCTCLEPAASNPMSFCRTEFFISLSPFLTQKRHFIPSPFSVSTAVTQRPLAAKICEYQHPHTHTHTAAEALSVGFILRRKSFKEPTAFTVEQQIMGADFNASHSSLQCLCGNVAALTPKSLGLLSSSGTRDSLGILQPLVSSQH